MPAMPRLARTARCRPTALGGVLILAGCSPTLGPGLAGTPNDIPRIAPGQAAEDGLTVGHRLMAAGEFELALRAYLQAAARQGMTVDTLSALGSANLKLGRLGQAEQLLRRALEQDPSFVPALNNLGVVLMDQDKPGAARVYFQQAFALDSGNSDEIRQNLRLAIAQSEAVTDTDRDMTGGLSLLRRGPGQYLLLSDL